jgi:hypothetical protein
MNNKLHVLHVLYRVAMLMPHTTRFAAFAVPAPAHKRHNCKCKRAAHELLAEALMPVLNVTVL